MPFVHAIHRLLVEVLDGPPDKQAYILNPGDPGMLEQLDKLDAAAASARPMPGHTTIAAHTDHVHYGFTLMNRWAAGDESAFATADWSASWKRGHVDDRQWRDLRANLRREVEAWKQAVAARTDWDEVAAAGVIASVAHTAYHLGAIRQLIAAQSLPGAPA